MNFYVIWLNSYGDIMRAMYENMVFRHQRKSKNIYIILSKIKIMHNVSCFQARISIINSLPIHIIPDTKDLKK